MDGIVCTWDRAYIPGVAVWTLTVNHSQNGIFSWALWYVPIIPALKRLRQEDCHDF